MPEGIEALTLKSLPNHDNGKAARLFDNEMRRVINDIRDRPGDKSKRIVTLKVVIAPQEVDGGECETAGIQFHVHSSVPKKHTREYTMLVHKNDQLSFSPTCPDNPRQKTFEEAHGADNDEGDEGADE